MCVRVGCKRECDELTKMYCIDRLTKEQAQLKQRIGNSCKRCHEIMVRARQNKRWKKLCTSCGEVYPWKTN